MITPLQRNCIVKFNAGVKIRGIKAGLTYKVAIDESRSEYLFICTDPIIKERQSTVQAFAKYSRDPNALKKPKPIRRAISLIDYYYNRGEIEIIS